MYAIGDVIFETYEEAKEYAAENLCGTYSIDPLYWCEKCRDWERSHYEASRANGFDVCQRCGGDMADRFDEKDYLREYTNNQAQLRG